MHKGQKPQYCNVYPFHFLKACACHLGQCNLLHIHYYDSPSRQKGITCEQISLLIKKGVLPFHLIPTHSQDLIPAISFVLVNLRPPPSTYQNQAKSKISLPSDACGKVMAAKIPSSI